VVSEPRVMMSDGSLRVSKECDVIASESATSRKAQWKGKSRAPPPTQLSRDNTLKPKTYMSFLMRFIHKELFIRNTKETIIEEYNVPEVITFGSRCACTQIHAHSCTWYGMVNVDLYSACCHRSL